MQSTESAEATLYPGGGGASREALATVFEAHGFAAQAKQLRDVDAERALGAAVGPVAQRRGADGIKIDAIEAESADDHKKAYAVTRYSRQAGERMPVQEPGGARVFTYMDQVYAAAPRPGDGPEIPECRAVAEAIATEANWRITNARFSTDVSKALTNAVRDGGACRFTSKGSYIGREGTSGTARLVALFNELRATFYNEATRQGLRTTPTALRGGDEQALSDSVVDALETKVEEIAANMRAEAGNSKTRKGTLQKRRDECEALLADLNNARELCGAFAERLSARVGELKRSYDGAVDAVSLELPAWVTDDSEADDNAVIGPVATPATPAEPEPTAEPTAEPTEDPFSL
jgi:hypothetical protein